jgi:hypothetical protein
LAARFPEREEYVINTSEFNRVKARLLRLSNTRATASGLIAGSDDNNGTPGRPTLKRRQPTPDDTTVLHMFTAKIRHIPDPIIALWSRLSAPAGNRT